MKRIRIFAMLWTIAMMVFGTLSIAFAAGQPETVSLVVKLVNGIAAVEQSAVIARDGGIETSSIPALRLHVIEVPALDLPLILQNYQSDSQVESVELNKKRKAEGIPGDLNYGVQWALSKIGWESIFGTLTPSGSAKLAILDTGVDASHPDLAGNIIPGISILTGTNGFTDPNGHGTSLAGIIAALTDNGEGIAGISYAGVHVMPVTVLDANGIGQDSDIIAGIIWAADQGADVILMGFSNPDFSQNLQDAIDYAWLRGAVMVAATGNDGVNTPTFPAGNRGVIGVSATDQNDALAVSSNYGQDVFLAAPGTEIFTTSLGSSYTYINGTSASSAIVAGVAAFMKAVDPALTNGVIVGRMARSADAIGTAGDQNNPMMFGNGRVNMASALADEGSDEVQPAGASPVGSGGPFVGPYAAAGFWKPVESISSSSQSATLTQGSAGSATYTVTVKAEDGWVGWATLSVEGLPAGAVASFNVNPVAFFLNGNNTVTTIMTITTTAATPAGTFTLTIKNNHNAITGGATLVIGNAIAPTTLTLSGLAQTYDGAPKTATATTNPAGLIVTFTYDGSPTAPTNAGTYAVLGNINDTNHQVSATGTLIIGKRTLAVTAIGVSKQYDGTTDAAITLADDRNAGDPLTVSYSGSTFADSNVGAGKLVMVTGLTLGGVAAGNYQLSSTSVTTTADITDTAPVFSATSPASDSYRNTAVVGYTLDKDVINGTGTVTFTWTGGSAADPFSPHTYTMTAPDMTAGSHTINTGLSIVNGAIYTVSFNVADGAGYAAETVANTNVLYDASAAAITLTDPAAGSSFSNTTVNYTLSKTVVSATIIYTWTSGPADGGSPHMFLLSGGDLSAGPHTVTTGSSLVDGAVYSVDMSNVVDLEGNASSVVSNANVTYDTTSVTISGASPSAGSKVKTAAVSYALSEQALSGKISFTRTGGNEDSGSPRVYTMSGTDLAAGPHSVDTGLGLVDGTTYTVSFDARDAAGNAATTVSNGSIVVDQTAPQDGTLSAIPEVGQIALSWSEFTDATSGIGSYTLVVDTTPPDSCSVGTVLYTGSNTTHLHTGLSNSATYYYRLCAADSAGNVSAGATANATLKAIPTISWANPADIPSGMPLSDIQLNAIASVPGSFVYSPASGTVLGVGNNQILSVNFIPSDTNKYSNTSATVRINVFQLIPCGAPAALSVPATNTTGSVFVSWGTSNVSGVTYILEQSSNGGAFTPVYSGTAMYVNLAVTANGTYTYQVKAVKANYADSGYTTGSTNTCSVTLACGAPTALSVPATNTTGSVFVSWGTSNVSGVTYILEQSFNGGAFTPVYSGTAMNVNLTMTANGTYTYQVKAVKANYADSGYTAGSTNTCSVTLTCGAPSSLIVPATNTTGSVFVSWGTSDVSGVTYILGQSFNGGAFIPVYSGTATNVNLAVTANGTYTYQVKAVKANYADSEYKSGATNTCSVNLACGAPAALSVPATNTTGSVFVSWGTSDVSGVTYILEQSFNGGAFTPVYSGTAMNVNLAVTTNGTYTYQVKAVKANYADSGYKSGATNTCNVTLACGAPAALSVPATNTTGSVFVSWGTSDVSGVTYILEQSFNGGAFTPVYSGTAMNVNLAVTTNGTYTYQVKAVKANYADSGYTTGSTRTCSVTLTCGAPAALTVPATNTTGSVSVSWGTSDVSGVTYILEQSFNGGAFTPVYSGTAMNVNLAVTTNGTYTYQVKAVKANYADSGYKASSFTCSVTLTCGAPSFLIVPATNTTGSVPVSWGTSDVSGVTYILEQSFNGGAFTPVYSGPATNVNLTLSANGTYTYQVKAVKANYADSGYTTGSTNTCSVTLTCGAPTALSVPATNTTGSVYVSWGTSDVSGVTYILEQSFNGGAFTPVYSGPATNVNLTLSAYGTYTYQVKAVKANYADSGYTTGSANTCSVTLTCGAPSFLIVPATNTTGSVPVSWGTSDVSGVTYILEQSFNGGAFTPVYSGPATNVNLTLSAYGTYTYQVKAVKANYADSGYTTGSTNTCSMTLACGAPASLTVPATNTTGTVYIMWGTSNVSGVTYILEQSFNGAAFTQVYSGTARNVNLTVTTNGTYTYRVKAVKANYADSGYTTGSTNTCSVTLACGAPASLTVPATNSTGTVYVLWGTSNVSGVTYILEQSFNGGAFTQVYSGTATNVNLTVTTNGTYTYRVKAVKANYANSGYTTGSTNTCSVTLACGAPASLTVPATNSTGSVYVLWGTSNVSGVTYILEQSTNGGAFTPVYSGPNKFYTINGLANGTYSYRVKAVKTNYVDSSYRISSVSCIVTK